MCGEHSSSVMWSPFRRGIIPACAGSTHPQDLPLPTFRDHPRMCGEHAITLPGGGLFSGSSPHVRGALYFELTIAAPAGIIPACAGSTLRGRACRGDKRGSSPHVRGAPDRVLPDASKPGIIPACAGSTWFGAARNSPPRDHPRMCGEHAKVPRVSRLQ